MSKLGCFQSEIYIFLSLICDWFVEMIWQVFLCHVFYVFFHHLMIVILKISGDISFFKMANRKVFLP